MKDKAKLFTKDGIPKYIACYEVKRNPTIDRFTVVYTRLAHHDKGYRGIVLYRGMDERPFHPHGFGQFGEAQQGKFCPGGSKIQFSELSADCQRLVISDYCDLWDIGGYEVSSDGKQVRLNSIDEFTRSA